MQKIKICLTDYDWYQYRQRHYTVDKVHGDHNDALSDRINLGLFIDEVWAVILMLLSATN